jgi:CDP-glucose 4,6-dehydratase
MGRCVIAGAPFDGCYKAKRVLVTGHTGFKGSWLAAWLLQLGAEVHGLSLGMVTEPSLFEVLGLERRIHHQLGDIRDPEVLARLLKELRPDVVFHLAAQSIVHTSLLDPLATFSTNTMGTVNLLEGLRALETPCQVVVITSDKAYRNQEWEWGYRETDELGGRDPYSASKACAELVIRAYHASYFSQAGSPIRIASTRAGNVIGGGDWAVGRVVPDCIRAWSQGQAVEVRNPSATRPWQHVLEPLSGYLTLGCALVVGAPVAGESFNFGPASDVTAPVLDLIETLAEHWPFDGQEERIRVVPHADPNEARLLRLSCDKALVGLKWRPTLDLEQALALTARWYERFACDGTPQMFDFTLEQLAEYVGIAQAKGLSWTGATQTI